MPVEKCGDLLIRKSPSFRGILGKRDRSRKKASDRKSFFASLGSRIQKSLSTGLHSLLPSFLVRNIRDRRDLTS